MRADPQTSSVLPRQNNDGAAPARKTFSIEALREFLRYEPETGNLYWLPRDAKWFTADRHCKGWNRRNAGRLVVCSGRLGYSVVHIYSRTFLAHRVIWAIVHGEWPDEIDHIDGDPTNNRLENLRAVSRQENARNLPAFRTSQRGELNIRHLPKKKFSPERWEVILQRPSEGSKKRKVFHSLDEARAFRDAALAEAGFHPNHGRASRSREATA